MKKKRPPSRDARILQLLADDSLSDAEFRSRVRQLMSTRPGRRPRPEFDVNAEGERERLLYFDVGVFEMLLGRFYQVREEYEQMSTDDQLKKREELEITYHVSPTEYAIKKLAHDIERAATMDDDESHDLRAIREYFTERTYNTPHGWLARKQNHKKHREGAESYKRWLNGEEPFPEEAATEEDDNGNA